MADADVLDQDRVVQIIRLYFPEAKIKDMPGGLVNIIIDPASDTHLRVQFHTWANGWVCEGNGLVKTPVNPEDPTKGFVHFLGMRPVLLAAALKLHKQTIEAALIASADSPTASTDLIS